MHLAPHNDAVLAAAGVVLSVDVVVGQHAVYGGLRALPAVLAERPEEQQVGFGFDRVRHLGQDFVPHESFTQKRRDKSLTIQHSKLRISHPGVQPRSASGSPEVALRAPWRGASGVSWSWRTAPTGRKGSCAR